MGLASVDNPTAKGAMGTKTAHTAAISSKIDGVARGHYWTTPNGCLVQRCLKRLNARLYLATTNSGYGIADQAQFGNFALR